MIEIEQSKRYDAWISTLRDRKAVATVTARIERIRMAKAMAAER